MIYDVSDPQTTPKRAGGDGARVRLRWWSRLSPWLWGLLLLLVIAGIAGTQVPRLSMVFSAPATKPGPAAPAVVPTLSGPAYTQAMVEGRDFVGADLRGARLIRLDLRGQDFQGADAAGAVFAGSLLNGANFSHVDLRGADLRGTCLRGANLTEAQLAGADFTDADVTGATVTLAATAEAIGWVSVSAASAVCPQG